MLRPYATGSGPSLLHVEECFGSGVVVSMFLLQTWVRQGDALNDMVKDIGDGRKCSTSSSAWSLAW